MGLNFGERRHRCGKVWIMADVYGVRLDALQRTWQTWARTGESLSGDQWTAQTRCDGWDVAALYAHASMFLKEQDAPLPEADAPGNPVTAVEIVRSFNEPGGVAHAMADATADQAVADAAQHSRGELVERFAAHAPLAMTKLRAARPTLVVPWGPFVATIEEVARMAVMEATVHLLDLQRALGQQPDVPAEALQDTTQFLAAVASPVAFIEAAAGRSQDSPLPVLR
jgi:uncharacterized protein (TIGR03083 family)